MDGPRLQDPLDDTNPQAASDQASSGAPVHDSPPATELPRQPGSPAYFLPTALQVVPIPGQIVVEGVVMLPAGFLWRFMAFAIDAFILGILTQILIAAAGIPQPDQEAAMAGFTRLMASGCNMRIAEELAGQLKPPWYEPVLLYLMYGAYFTLLQGILGASLGKLALGLQVRYRDGRPIGIAGALARYLLYFLSKWVAYTAWWIGFDRERRTIYDAILRINVFRPVPPG